MKLRHDHDAIVKQIKSNESRNEKMKKHTLPIAPRTIVASQHPYAIAYCKGASMYMTESWQFKTCNLNKFQALNIDDIEEKKEKNK